MANRRAVSRSFSAEFGSSRMSRRGRSTSTRLISTSWRSSDRGRPRGRRGPPSSPSRASTRTRSLEHRRPIDEPEPGRLVIGEEVGEDRALGKEAQLLVDDADAGSARVLRRAEGDRLPVESDVAAVGSHRPSQDLHERRLAGAVLADDRVDGACLDVEVHVDEGPDATV